MPEAEKVSITEVYKNRIEEAKAEYIDYIGDESELENTDVFNGLIDFINMRVFTADRRTREYKTNTYQNRQNNALNYTDTENIFDLWSIYKILCSKYHKTYTMQQFCSMTGISTATFAEWQQGTVRGATKEHSQLAKKIRQDSESATLGKALNGNSVSAMFVLKAGFGWREDQKLIIEQATERHETPAEIAARYGAAELPERPDFELSDNLDSAKTDSISATTASQGELFENGKQYAE